MQTLATIPTGLHTLIAMVMSVFEPTSDSMDDRELYERYRSRGDERALEALLGRHWARIYNLARRIVRDPALAEDAAQQAFVAAAQSEQYRGEGTFGGWLTLIAVNEARKALRSGRRRGRHEDVAGRAAGRPPRRDPVEERELASVLEAHLDELPEELRTPIVLRYSEGMTHEEVARTLDVPAGTASSRLRRGLERLRESLARAGYAVSIAELEALLEEPQDGPTPAAPSASTLLAAARRRRLRRIRDLALRAGMICAAVIVAMALFFRLGPGARTNHRDSVTRRPGVVRPASASHSKGRDETAAHSDPTEAPAPAGSSSPPANGADEAGAQTTARTNGVTGPGHVPLLTVRVVAEKDGSPLENAEVFFGPWEEFGDVITGRDGLCRIELPEGVELDKAGSLVKRDLEGREVRRLLFFLGVRRDHMEPAVLPVHPEDLSLHRTITVALRAGGASVEGRVVSRATGAPLAGVKLEVSQVASTWFNQPGEVRCLMETDAKGSFHVGGLRASGGFVCMTDERYGAQLVALHKLKEAAPMKIAVEPAARLHIDLVDESSAPVPAFMVVFSHTGALYLSGTSRAGRDGHCDVRGLAASSSLGVTAWVVVGDHREFAYGGNVAVSPGEVTSLRMVLKHGLKRNAGFECLSSVLSPNRAAETRAVAGVVLGPDGAPFGGARVELQGRVPFTGAPAWTEWTREDGAKYVTTDPLGRFEFDGIPRKDFQVGLLVEASGFAAKILEFAPDLSGTNVKPPGAQDYGFSRTTSLGGGTTSRSTKFGETPLPSEAAAGKIVVRLESLERSPSFSVLVRPPSEVTAGDLSRTLKVYVAGQAGVQPKMQPTASGELDVSIPGSRGQETAIILYVPGSTWCAVAEHVQVGASPTRVEISTDAGATVTGRIISKDGTAAANADIGLGLERDLVKAAQEIMGSPWKCRTDANGHFRLTGLPRAHAFLLGYAISPSLSYARVAVDLSKGGEIDVGELRLGDVGGAAR